MKRVIFKMVLGSLFTCMSLSAETDRATVFSNIYENAAWGVNQEGIGYSGSGSKLENALLYMDFLKRFLKENNISSLVDVGCGDWTFSKFLNWGNAKYYGIDPVHTVIERNKKKFESENVVFVCGDAIETDLPKADLLVCKDVLQHLSNEDISLFLTQIKKYKHCLITNDTHPSLHTSNNPQIATGDYRQLDLTAPPFNLKGVKVLHYRSENVTKQVLYINNSETL